MIDDLLFFNHMGYSGHATRDEAAGYYGRVIGIRDVVTFRGPDRDAARLAFEDSVEDYLAMCAERGEEPDRPGPATQPVGVSVGPVPDEIRALYPDDPPDASVLATWDERFDVVKELLGSGNWSRAEMVPVGDIIRDGEWMRYEVGRVLLWKVVAVIHEI